MARTYTHPSQDENFLEGFTDQQSVWDQIYLFQVKTRNGHLDNALYGRAHEGAPAENIAFVLELSTWSDAAAPKAAELAARFRKEVLQQP